MAYYENDPRRNGSSQYDGYDRAYQQYQQAQYQAPAMGYAESPYLTMGQYMARTFGWMFAGLMLTFAVAVATVLSGAFVVLYSTGLVFALSIGELVLVAVLSMRVQKLRPATATALFFGYAALTGVNLSVYFVVYDLATLVLAFLVGAVYFGIMAVYGWRTKRDLIGWGPMLFAGLMALLIVSLLGSLFSVFFATGFGLFDVLLCAVGLLVFMGFTAYDTQKLRRFYAYYGGDGAMLHKSSIIGALQLYLDYINIFLYVIRLLGRSRNN